MITIDDYDLPITVAQKIITGTSSVKTTSAMKDFMQAITGIECDEEDLGPDMFTLDEILEISLYLKTYYDTHKDRGD